MGIITKLIVAGAGVFAYKEYQKKKQSGPGCQRDGNRDFDQTRDSQTQLPPQYPYSEVDVKNNSGSMSGGQQHPEKY